MNSGGVVAIAAREAKSPLVVGGRVEMEMEMGVKVTGKGIWRARQVFRLEWACRFEGTYHISILGGLNT